MTDPIEAREAMLRRVQSAFTDRIPVINSVRVRDLSAPPADLLGLTGNLFGSGRGTSSPAAPPSSPRAAKKAERRRRRAEKRLARRLAKAHRDPEARIDFTEWVAIAWQARPVEARLADVAHHLAGLIAQCPAWRHPLLDSQRLRLNPTREAADIALAAYRLYRQRTALGPRPAGGQNPVLNQARALFDAHHQTLTDAWFSLLDRVATLDSYRQHLTELAPILSAQAAVTRLADVRLDQDMTSVYADAALNELVAADTRELTDSVDGIGAALAEIIGRIDRDVQLLSTLNRPLP